jgi:hypothetical protein
MYQVNPMLVVASLLLQYNLLLLLVNLLVEPIKQSTSQPPTSQCVYTDWQSIALVMPIMSNSTWHIMGSFGFPAQTPLAEPHGFIVYR